MKTNLLKTQVKYARDLPHIAKRIYPNTNGLIKIKKNVRFCMWGLFNPKPLKQMLSVLSEPYFQDLLVCRTDLLEKPLKPYVCVSWTSQQRTKCLIDHLNIMKAFWGVRVSAILSSQGVDILQFSDRQDATYKLKLFAGEDREGALGLKLTDDDDQHIYSVTFNLSQQNGIRTMHIGALQGPSNRLNSRSETIKRLTKATHGLRTKALMLEFALMFAKQFKMEELQGVSNKGHIYQALRYIIGSKGKSVSFNYDQLWLEYGATPVDQYLYRIPLCPKRKKPEELNKTKRKLYEKRYSWLAQTEQIFNFNLTKLNINNENETNTLHINREGCV